MHLIEYIDSNEISEYDLICDLIIRIADRCIQQNLYNKLNQERKKGFKQNDCKTIKSDER